jgi:DNA-binding NtrC family response regulator
VSQIVDRLQKAGASMLYSADGGSLHWDDMKILIVDDDVFLVEALCRHFERRGYQPTGVFTVLEATAAIEKAARTFNPFVAILSDLQLPDGDGRTIVRLAREKLPNCPVVMMTGSRSVSGSVEAMRLGALTVLEKPVPLEVLSVEIAQAIKQTAQIPEGAASRAPGTAALAVLPPEGLDLYAVLGELEDRLIHEALARTQGNKNQAARVLGLNRTTLTEKLRRMSRRAGGASHSLKA